MTWGACTCMLACVFASLVCVRVSSGPVDFMFQWSQPRVLFNLRSASIAVRWCIVYESILVVAGSDVRVGRWSGILLKAPSTKSRVPEQC